MTPIQIMERAIARATRQFADDIAEGIYSAPPYWPDEFVGPMPQWRTWQTHRSEWMLDGGGPGDFWRPRFGTPSWIQEKLRYGP